MIKKRKRGISAIVATILLIALTIAVIGIVWGVVTNLVKSKTSSASACFNINEQVALDSTYTCYNSSSNKVLFFVKRGDISVDDILVSITGQGTSSTFKINEDSNLTYYPSGAPATGIPGKNEGKTYVYSLPSAFIPDTVEVAPIINGQQCGASSSISPIDDCSLLAS